MNESTFFPTNNDFDNINPEIWNCQYNFRVFYFLGSDTNIVKYTISDIKFIEIFPFGNVSKVT